MVVTPAWPLNETPSFAEDVSSYEVPPFDAVPPPPVFLDSVRQYNALVGECSVDGVRLRVPLDETRSAREHVEMCRFWDMVPLTYHAVNLMRAVCSVASLENWADPKSGLWVRVDLGAQFPQRWTFKGTAHIVFGCAPPTQLKIPIHHWFLLRMFDEPDSPCLSVISHQPEAQEMQKRCMTPLHFSNIRASLDVLANHGVLPRSGPVPFRTARRSHELDEVPAPRAFVDDVLIYNGTVGRDFDAATRVPHRVAMRSDRPIREQLRELWRVLPFTERSVMLLDAMCDLDFPKEEWADPHSGLWVDFDLGTNPPRQALTPDPKHVKVPAYFWLLLRLSEVPSLSPHVVRVLNPDDVFRLSPNFAETPRRTVGPIARTHIEDAVSLLAQKGVLVPVPREEGGVPWSTRAVRMEQLREEIQNLLRAWASTSSATASAAASPVPGLELEFERPVHPDLDASQ